VSGLFENPDDDATPLAPEERDGLIPTFVTYRHELNELEQANILEADTWAFGRRRDALDESFLKGLHRRMFRRVWRWAGDYRATERNIGVPPYRIPVEMRQLLDDARYWLANATYPPDELAIRLHHKLVLVHPFPNGNGRWSRLAADIFIVAQGRGRFTWGSANLQPPGDIRRAYIDALHAADNHDLQPLLAFARS
jgi:Fic-DOC domain mobile mystery protein B